MKLPRRYKTQADILKAVASPARLFIIEQLAEGEKCVKELAEALQLEMSTVSKHLSVLRNAGIVTDEKRSNQVFYTLRTPCVLNFFQCVLAVQEDRVRQERME